MEGGLEGVGEALPVWFFPDLSSTLLTLTEDLVGGVGTAPARLSCSNNRH